MHTKCNSTDINVCKRLAYRLGIVKSILKQCIFIWIYVLAVKIVTSSLCRNVSVISKNLFVCFQWRARGTCPLEDPWFPHRPTSSLTPSTYQTLTARDSASGTPGTHHTPIPTRDVLHPVSINLVFFMKSLFYTNTTLIHKVSSQSFGTKWKKCSCPTRRPIRSYDICHSWASTANICVAPCNCLP